MFSKFNVIEKNRSMHFRKNMETADKHKTEITGNPNSVT